MKKLTLEKKYKKIKQFKIIFAMLVLFLISLVALQIYFANQLVEVGIKIREKGGRIEELKAQNQQLSEKIARAVSLESIKIKAEKMKLKRLTSVIYLTDPLPVALNPQD